MASSRLISLFIASVSIIVTSCSPDKGTSRSKPSDVAADGSKSGTCAPGKVVSSTSCTSEIANSTNASITAVCNSKGTGVLPSTCKVEGCQVGYQISDSKCIPIPCISGTKDYISCASLEDHSIAAKKERSCSASGDGLAAGPCVIERCESGYELKNGKCLPVICTASVALGAIDCSADIPNSAQASRSKSCNAQGTGYDYGTCSLSKCASGFYAVGSSCVAQSCTPDQSLGNTICVGEIPNSLVATKSITCSTTGDGYRYGSCNLNSCLDGYAPLNGVCQPQVCTPDAILTPLDCSASVTNSLVATATKTCNAQGLGYTYGSCVVQSCNTGFHVVGVGCVANNTLKFTGTSDPNSPIEYRFATSSNQPWHVTGECNIDAGAIALSGTGMKTPMTVPCNSNGMFEANAELANIGRSNTIIATQGAATTMTRVISAAGKTLRKITSVDDLRNIPSITNAIFVQTTNLDLSLISAWSPIEMVGIYEGMGHKITGLRSVAGGLFSDANTVSSLRIVDANVSCPSTKDKCGILAASARAIYEVGVSGSVTGFGDVGGIVGAGSYSDQYRINIYRSYSLANVTSSINAGGMIGAIRETNTTGNVIAIEGYTSGTIKSTSVSGSAGNMVGFISLLNPVNASSPQTFVQVSGYSTAAIESTNAANRGGSYGISVANSTAATGGYRLSTAACSFCSEAALNAVTATQLTHKADLPGLDFVNSFSIDEGVSAPKLLWESELPQ